MKIDDFRWMWRGRHVSALQPKDAFLLQAVERRNGKKQRALLLLHGFSSSPAVYRHLLTKLPDYDAVIAPILPGHAESVEAFHALKFEELLTFSEQICQNLCHEFASVDVMGLSLGGLLACHLSALFKLNHLYLLAPAIDIHLPLHATLQLAQWLDRLGFSRLRNQAGNIYSANVCEIAYRQLPLSAVIAMLRLIRDFKFTPPSCPTDLFLGHHDQVVASERVAQRFANIPSTNIHWLENSAHILPIDGDFEIIAECVKRNFR